MELQQDYRLIGIQAEFPDEKDGLWTVIENAFPSSRNFDIAAMKEKYKDVKRVVVR